MTKSYESMYKRDEKINFPKLSMRYTSPRTAGDSGQAKRLSDSVAQVPLVKFIHEDAIQRINQQLHRKYKSKVRLIDKTDMK